MSAQKDGQKKDGTARNNLASEKETCAKMSDVEARNRKLEAIERQLHFLIGQVRQLKTN